MQMTPYLLNEAKTHNLKRLTCQANALVPTIIRCCAHIVCGQTDRWTDQPSAVTLRRMRAEG